jgi:hypothetical protein
MRQLTPWGHEEAVAIARARLAEGIDEACEPHRAGHRARHWAEHNGPTAARLDEQSKAAGVSRRASNRIPLTMVSTLAAAAAKLDLWLSA